jgi:hypothetical protein
MKWLLVPVVLFAVPALAHVEPGLYKGVTEDGKECSMVAGKQYFENGVRHPLNERFPITVDGKAFVVGHPPIVDSQQAIAYFNHDLLQGVLPTDSGAIALEIEMVHSQEFEGPRRFTLIEHAWKADHRTAFKCNDLRLSK